VVIYHIGGVLGIGVLGISTAHDFSDPIGHTADSEESHGGPGGSFTESRHRQRGNGSTKNTVPDSDTNRGEGE
jgi:hypothetical protein